MLEYRRLGLEVLINAKGTVTALGGSTLSSKTAQAAAQASQAYVRMPALMERIGDRIARLIGVEAACVTAGAAAGLTVSAAACMAGEDAARIHRLPDSNGIPSEVLILKAHRCPYDQAVRLAGASIVEVGTAHECSPSQLSAALGDRTAAIFYFAQSESSQGSVPLREVVRVARTAGVPLVVDAAAELPPVSNLRAYLAAGADMAIFSGGKDLRGPQASGLILGAVNWVRACRANSFPNYSVGRPMKVDKGAAVGLLRAVESYLAQDFESRAGSWDEIAAYFVDELSGIPGVKVRRDFPLAPGVQPVGIARAFVEIDSAALGRGVDDILDALEKGEPPIVTDQYPDGLILNPQLLEEAQARIVAARLKALLTSG